MDLTTAIVLFCFGIAIGSFVNVLALRYDGDRNVFDTKVIGGRSHCPQCKKTLAWYELIPVVSFVIQGGRCRTCDMKIGWQYPAMELISGALFVLVPLRLASYPWTSSGDWALFSTLWIIAFEILLLIAYIDIRLQIVPDELDVVLGVVAIFEVIFAGAYLDAAHQSFFGPLAQLFGFYGNAWTGHVLAAVFATGFFGLIVLVTRGKGMGMGDVKLALPLGLLFGWPDILLLYAAAFIIGSVVGVGLIAFKQKTRRSAVPFVPFLAIGAAFVFFLGFPLVEWYFHIIGL